MSFFRFRRTSAWARTDQRFRNSSRQALRDVGLRTFFVSARLLVTLFCEHFLCEKFVFQDFPFHPAREVEINLCTRQGRPMGPSWQRVRMACPKCMSALWSWCAVGQSGLSPHQMSRFQVDVELFSVSSVFPMQFFSSICKTKKKGHERKRDIQCAKVDIGPFFSSSACSADNRVGVWGSD